MFKQGQILKVNLNPTIGHEQSGYRLALIISNEDFNNYTNLCIVCPISNTNNNFPLHIPLDKRTQTMGFVLCEHLKTLNLNARKTIYIEDIPKDILTKVIKIIKAEF